jgi:Flp pilus assembly pilin Flp
MKFGPDRIRRLQQHWRHSRHPWVRRSRVIVARWSRQAEQGATMLEWTLLLVAIALPAYFIIQLGLRALFAHYRLVTTLNGLPFP